MLEQVSICTTTIDAVGIAHPTIFTSSLAVAPIIQNS